MREIKLRAWDEINKRFYFWGCGLIGANTFTGSPNPSYPNQQYTGLKDRNGVEIYDGDIIHLVKNRFGEGRHEVWSVQYGYFGDPHKLYVSNHINSGREIEYDLDELYYINPEGVMTPIPYFSKTGEDKTELRVIGNIYENPELLCKT